MKGDSKSNKCDFNIDGLLESELDIESLKTIKEDGIRLMESIDQSTETVIRKAHNLFQIVLVVTSALIGLIFTKDKLIDSEFIIILSVIVCALLIHVLFRLHKISYSIHEFRAIGTEPEKILDKEILYSSNAQENSKLLLRNNIQTIQNSINRNLICHVNIVRKFENTTKYVIETFTGALVCSIIYYSLTSILSWMCP